MVTIIKDNKIILSEDHNEIDGAVYVEHDDTTSVVKIYTAPAA